MLSGMTAHLILVRHGESTWNAEHRMQGQADPPLSALGREQARDLLPYLAALPAGRSLTSDLERARATAALLGLDGATADPSWREIDLGEWSGRRLEDLDAEDVAAWRRGELSPPGGEPWPAFQARVGSAVDALAAAGTSVLVVTHGGCVRAACAHLIGADSRRLAPPANASATVIEVGPRVRLHAYGLRPPMSETPGVA